MGASLGGSYGSTSSQATSSSNLNKTFSAPQTLVQNQLGGNLSNDLAAANQGTLSPGVTAQKTQAADSINTEAGGLQDRVTKFLAARGFGKSGETGKATLQGELGRQAALGNNEANFAGQQNTLNQANLLAALNYAFNSLGQSATGSTSGDSSGWGISAGVGVGKGGVGH